MPPLSKGRRLTIRPVDSAVTAIVGCVSALITNAIASGPTAVIGPEIYSLVLTNEAGSFPSAPIISRLCPAAYSAHTARPSGNAAK